MSHNHPKHSLTPLRARPETSDPPKANILKKVNFQVCSEAKVGHWSHSCSEILTNLCYFHHL